MTEEKKTNWAGIAALVAALTAVPGVLVNTYLDYTSRNTSELVQKSSYINLSTTVEKTGNDVELCLDEVSKLKVELAELKGYLRGMRRGGGGTPAALVPSPTPEKQPISSEDKKSDKVKAADRRSVSFDSIKQHVQSTGQVYIQPQSED